MSILTAVEQLSCRDMGWEKLKTFTHLGFLNLGCLAMGASLLLALWRKLTDCFLSQLSIQSYSSSGVQLGLSLNRLQR